jgi:lipopolysaccharide export system protein LptC
MTLVARVRPWLPVLPLLGILAMTYWLDQQAKPETEAGERKKQHTADAIIDQLKAVTLNVEGTPHFLMSAKQLVHYSDDDSTELVEPALTTRTSARPDVHMTALKGTLSSKGDVIELFDNVEIVRMASTSQGELSIKTDYVKVIPDAETAETTHAVTVDEDSNHLSAIGMELDNRAQTLKLLSRVKASNAISQN